MKEESTCSAPVALGLLAAGFWKPQGQDVEPPGFSYITYLSLSLSPVLV